MSRFNPICCSVAAVLELSIWLCQIRSHQMSGVDNKLTTL